MSDAQRATLPTDAKARKAIPIFSGCIRYFPDALAAVADLSRIGNEQHNPGKPLHWDRAKSTDELDALTRHLVDAGTIDTDGVRHSAKVAWRALANLQKEIERDKQPAGQVITAAAKTGKPAPCGYWGAGIKAGEKCAKCGAGWSFRMGAPDECTGTKTTPCALCGEVGPCADCAASSAR